jgi:hypothetical protein
MMHFLYNNTQNLFFFNKKVQIYCVEDELKKIRVTVDSAPASELRTLFLSKS